MFSEINQPNPDNIHDDDSTEAFIERVHALYAFESTALDDLIKLSRDLESADKFEDLLDDLTYNALDENGEFTQNISDIKNGSHTEEEKLALINRQKTLVSN